MDSLGKRLKYIRKQNGLTQIAFAQKIGVSQGTLSDLEKDKCLWQNKSTENGSLKIHKLAVS